MELGTTHEMSNENVRLDGSHVLWQTRFSGTGLWMDTGTGVLGGGWIGSWLMERDVTCNRILQESYITNYLLVLFLFTD